MSVVKSKMNELFTELTLYIQTDRELFKKNHEVSDDKFIRSSSDALKVLVFLREVFNEFVDFFEKYPSLKQVFDKDLTSYQELSSRESILELCFFDCNVIHGVEETCYCTDLENICSLDFASAKNLFHGWVSTIEGMHLATQQLLQNDFSIDTELKDLNCSCSNCVSGYYSNARLMSMREIEDSINHFKSTIEQNRSVSIDLAASYFFKMRAEIDHTLMIARKRLKRATSNRLNSIAKEMIKDSLAYPAPVVLAYSETIKTLCRQKLKQEGLREELIDDDEFGRFFDQLGVGIWKDEKKLDQEIRRLIKVVLAFKRKDISANILKEYLGEFWLHSSARRINRKIIYHMGPTNSGKTYAAINSLCSAKTGCYLAPLRLLAAELYDTMNAKGVPTTLLTGEEIVEVDGANHFSSTIEMAKLGQGFDCCVIDEIQMIADSHRGWAWTRALVNICAPEIHICGDASSLNMIKEVVSLTGDELEIKHYERMTELKVEAGHVVMGDLKKGDAVIVFSRRNALKYKADLEQVGYKVSVVYGMLSPEVRREQARKFDQGETDIIVSTDAIAMGMNLPIKRIVFTVLSKFVNSQEYALTDSEIKQIAGRAGRFQRFPVGYVTCLAKEKDGISRLNRALGSKLPQQDRVMVGPDLDIFTKVNSALEKNSLPQLKLSEFLRLFNTMKFIKPFNCVNLTDMIELTETVEDIDRTGVLTSAETFGFACAPVNLGLVEHVQFFVHILSNFVAGRGVKFDEIDVSSKDIDYLETSIKCIELYQWLSRHFNNKNFEYVLAELLENKGQAVSCLNDLLSEKSVRTCSSCGVRLEEESKFRICEKCFKRINIERRARDFEDNGRGGSKFHKRPSGGGANNEKVGSKFSRFRKKNR